MPTLLYMIIAVLLLPGFSEVALAESLSDIPQVKGIFLYEGLQHWLNVAYDFNDRESPTGASSSHTIKESYNASLQMALFDPRIFDANLQGGIIFDQNRTKNEDSTSSSKQNSSYQYNFSGSGLSKSRIPFTLLSYRTTDYVMNTYTPSTTTDNSGNEFSISFLNSNLLSRFRFLRYSVDTSVAGTRSNSTSNAYSYSAEHKIGIAYTTLNAAFSDQTGSTSNGDKLTSSTNSLGLTNSLNFGGRQAYSLLSSIQLNNTTVDNLPQRTISFTENFGAVLGRALTFTAGYMLTNNRTTYATELTREDTINQGNVQLKHQLFQSLYTDLTGDVTFKDSSDGKDDRYSILGDIRYIKKISSENLLSVGIGKGYSLVNRKLSSGLIMVNDEPHVAVHQGDVIVLTLADASLRSISAIKSRNPVFTYVEGVDYTVNYTLGRITILSGGGVRIDMDGNGTDLYITYTGYKDPQIKYSTDSYSLTSNLALFNKQLNLGAAWNEVKQRVVSGPAVNNLQNSRSLSLYANGNYDTFSGGVSYRVEVADRLKYQAFGANGSAIWQVSKSTFTVTAHDIYTKYDARLTSEAYDENNANLAILYSRNIMANSNLSLQAYFNDQRSQLRRAKDSVSLLAKYQITLNMITISLSGQSAWIIDSNGTSRNDFVHIDFTRYF